MRPAVQVGDAKMGSGRSIVPSAGVLLLSLALGAPVAVSQTTVNLTAPANNVIFALPVTITLKAGTTATAPATIVRVEFYANGSLIGTDTTKAFSFAWTNPTPGAYALTAIAFDSTGGQVTSNARSITVNASNQPPTVDLTAPANNSRFALPVTVTLRANATPPETNDTLARVDFLANGVLIGSDTSKTFSFTWTPSQGTYTLSAVATDGQGAQATSSARTITVASNQPPTVSLTAPANKAVFSSPGSITLKANATPPENNDTVTRVDFFANGSLIGSDTSKAYSFIWTNPLQGTYTLTAVATDGMGAQTTSNARTITVNTVANVPPTVTLMSPADGASFAWPATINLAATAADSDGTVARVDFFQGTTLIWTATTAPYAFSWTNVAQGTYAITAVATDDGGSMTTSVAANVTVNAGVARLYYIVPDHLDAPRYITDQSGNTVWSWDLGDPFGTSIPNDAPDNSSSHFDYPQRFPGQYFDRETGLHYNMARDYWPNSGRYLESDPLGLRAGLNTYSYVKNAPLTFVDSDGLDLTVTYYPGPVVDHIGIGVNSPTTYGLYPRERGIDVVLCKDVPGRVSNDRYVQDAKSQAGARSIVIKTTAMQDDFVRQYIESARNAGARRDSDLIYNLCSEQCTRFVIDALSAGGVGLPRFDSVRPKDLFDILQQTFGSL